jgi:predicted MFS family arabinose efflux permease
MTSPLPLSSPSISPIFGRLTLDALPLHEIPVLVAFAGTAVGGLALLAVGVALHPLAPRGLPLLAVFGLMSIGQSIATPSLQALISRSAASTDQGSVLGSAQSIGALARAGGPALGGVLYSGISPAAPFFAGAALLVGAVALAFPATARAASTLQK